MCAKILRIFLHSHSHRGRRVWELLLFSFLFFVRFASIERKFFDIISLRPFCLKIEKKTRKLNAKYESTSFNIESIKLHDAYRSLCTALWFFFSSNEMRRVRRLNVLECICLWNFNRLKVLTAWHQSECDEMKRKRQWEKKKKKIIISHNLYNDYGILNCLDTPMKSQLQTCIPCSMLPRNLCLLKLPSATNRFRSQTTAKA